MKYELVENKKYGYYSVAPLPNKEELKSFYEDKYYQEDFGSYEHFYSRAEIEYFEEDAACLECLFNELFPIPKERTLLDIGCGEGFQSNYFFSRGWKVSCLDYSNDGLVRHNNLLLKNFYKGDIDDNSLEPGKKYSLLLLKNVLEHVISPEDALQSIKNYMHEDSLLFIEVPNDYSSFQDFMVNKGYTKNTWFCPPEHLHYFQFTTIQSLLVESDFDLVSVQTGFQIEQFIMNSSSNYAKDRSLGKNAHMARVEISNFLRNQDIQSYIKLREASARLNFGRDIKIVVRLKTKL